MTDSLEVFTRIDLRLKTIKVILDHIETMLRCYIKR